MKLKLSIFLILGSIILFLWWISQPVEIIYNQDAPPFPQSIGSGEDPRR